MKALFSGASLILLTFLLVPFITDAQRRNRNATPAQQFPG